MIRHRWFRRPHQRRAAGHRPAEAPLTSGQMSWLLLCAGLTLALHLPWQPGWAGTLVSVLLLWRVLMSWRGWRPPHSLILLLLTCAAGIGVRFEYGYFFGKDPGVSLLALLLALKLLETRKARDLRSSLLLCFFLQLAAFLEDQTPLMAVLVLSAAWLALTALVSLSDAEAGARSQLRSSATLIGQGLPLMLLLFLLFPRIEGPLWGMPADAFSGRTGLSDSMTPGSISQLSESAEIVMRARFAGELPPRNALYWRGPVLSNFDGRSWTPGLASEAPAPSYLPDGDNYPYQLTLEAHGKRWLTALDHSRGEDPRLRYTSDYRLLAQQPLHSRLRLQLTAYPEARIGIDEHPLQLAAARKLPPEHNPRTRALAARLTADSPRAEVILERALAHFRAAGLAYTLRPPLLGHDSVDEFLFDTRQGFCEHFASAFAVLLRAAGLPVRIVTGYQGGEINPVDGNLVIRQLDAHAWTEVWLAERGWVRVDPTYAAAPQRIDDGLAAALADEAFLPFTLRSNSPWLRYLRLNWEAAADAWNQRVLGFNPQRQAELLRNIGLDAGNRARLFGLILLGASLSMLFLLLWLNRPQRTGDELDRLWQNFSRKLARHQPVLARQAAEGPLDYVRRLASALPAQRKEIEAIGAEYARLRYGPPLSPAIAAATRRQLRTRIEHFSPR
ncbi:MAG: DUF3488 and transglutaminase-like domain-containing protein [Thauera sp.]|jgi:transglutaminase-like putative cysteine protease|nr:DUF3488 and transglutaminase-like domain-containing protein [Thauera sp.]